MRYLGSMKKLSLKEFLDKTVEEALKGRPEELSFRMSEDSEGDKNRGWRVDKLEALMNGEPVGYLKMSWIPRERFQREFPNILQYMAKMQGKGGFNPEYSPYDMNTPLGRIKAMLDANDWSQKSSKNPELDQMNPKQTLAMEKELLKGFERGFGKEFAKFKNHWMDKPLVDYIRVKENFQRKGIAIAMYEEGAKHLATMGLKLYASNNQQPGAKAAWEWLKVHAGANVGMDGTRMFLSFL